MELRVNDYIRTDDGLIMKIEKIERNVITTDISLNDYSSNLINRKYLKEIIIKSSPNIIDLIEVGDYVNRMQVTRICFDEHGERILNLSNCILELMNEDIKSILTKEQFESMEYRIGE